MFHVSCPKRQMLTNPSYSILPMGTCTYSVSFKYHLDDEEVLSPSACLWLPPGGDCHPCPWLPPRWLSCWVVVLAVVVLRGGEGEAVMSSINSILLAFLVRAAMVRFNIYSIVINKFRKGETPLIRGSGGQ